MKTPVWEILKNLRGSDDTPRVVGGDFNEILWRDEKQGGRDRPSQQIMEFREVVDACNLMDLDFFGEFDTWFHRNHNGGPIFERLDRICFNPTLRAIFPSGTIFHLDYKFSNHRPLELLLSKRSHERRPSWKRPFHFEEVWLETNDLSSMVEEAWNVGGES